MKGFLIEFDNLTQMQRTTLDDKRVIAKKLDIYLANFMLLALQLYRY